MCRKKHIKGVARQLDLPIVKNPCPADGKTKRQDMKELLKTLNDVVRGDAAAKLIQAISNVEQYQLWDKIDRKPVEIE